MEAFARLKERFPTEDECESDDVSRLVLVGAISTIDFYEKFQDPRVRLRANEPFVDRDIRDALFQLRACRGDLDGIECRLIGAAQKRGLTWHHIAYALGVGSPQAAQQRYKRLVESMPEDERLDPDAGRG